LRPTDPVLLAGGIRLWATKGYRPAGYQGPPVVLKAVRVGGVFCTLPEWVEEFELARAAMGAVRA